MAIDAHGRRIELLVRSESLIFQHVGVTAALAVVCRKRITGPYMSANIGETKIE